MYNCVTAHNLFIKYVVRTDHTTLTKYCSAKGQHSAHKGTWRHGLIFKINPESQKWFRYSQCFILGWHQMGVGMSHWKIKKLGMECDSALTHGHNMATCWKPHNDSGTSRKMLVVPQHSEDSVAGHHNSKGIFVGYDIVIGSRFQFELCWAWGKAFSSRVGVKVIVLLCVQTNIKNLQKYSDQI